MEPLLVVQKASVLVAGVKGTARDRATAVLKLHEYSQAHAKPGLEKIRETEIF
jgi:hypothetical protein